MLLLLQLLLLLHHHNNAASATSATSTTSRDVTISVADASLNSAAKILSVEGALDFIGLIPDVNTSLLSSLLPCAFQTCPGCPLSAKVIVLQAPFIQFSKNHGASASISGSVVTFLVNETEIARANANASIVLNFSQSEDHAGYIKIHASIVELYIDIESTCAGTIVSPTLKIELNSLVKNIFFSRFISNYFDLLFDVVYLLTHTSSIFSF